MSVLESPLWEAEHVDYRESFRTFLAREVVPAYRTWDAIPRGLLETMGEHGFLGPHIPEDLVDDTRFGAIVGQEAKMALAPAVALTLTAHNDVAVPALIRAGEASGDLATGERLLAVGEGSFTLNGALTGSADCVVAATFADAFFVPVGDDVAVVERDDVTVERAGPDVGLDAGGLARVIADGAAALVLPGAAATAQSDRALSLAIVAAAGVRAALRTTVEYTADRQAFGQPIASFENTRRTLATIAAETEMAEAWVERALRGQSVDPHAGKLVCTELHGRAVDAGLQFHGGYGYIMEYDIAHQYADARVLRLLGLPTQHAQDRIGASLF